MYHLFPLYHSRILKNLNTLHICRVRLLQQGESQAVGAVSLTIQSCNFNLMPYIYITAVCIQQNHPGIYYCAYAGAVMVMATIKNMH